MKTVVYFLSLLLISASVGLAKEFEKFDGQVYNGLFYPLVDVIEWGEQNGELPHLEYHIHQKDKPIDMGFYVGERGGKKVIWMMYDLKYRGERVCRHTLAPAQFKEGMQLYYYRDTSDKDYDQIFVFSEPRGKKSTQDAPKAVAYTALNYEPCTDENASNPPGKEPQAAASAPAAAAPGANRSPNSAAAPVQRDPKGVKIDYENNALPFSF